MDPSQRLTAVAIGVLGAASIAVGFLFLPWFEMDSALGGDASVTLRGVLNRSDWDDGTGLQRLLYDGGWHVPFLLGAFTAWVPVMAKLAAEDGKTGAELSWVLCLPGAAWAGYLVLLIQDAIEGSGVLSPFNTTSLNVGSGAWLSLFGIAASAVSAAWIGRLESVRAASTTPTQ